MIAPFKNYSANIIQNQMKHYYFEKKTIFLNLPTWISGTPDYSTNVVSNTPIGALIDDVADLRIKMKEHNGSQSWFSSQYGFANSITTSNTPVNTFRCSVVNNNLSNQDTKNTIYLGINNASYCSGTYDFYATIQYTKITNS